MKKQVLVERPNAGVLWGIKIQGGRDFGQKLRLTEINKDGIVASHGLKPGSEIVSIGGKPTASMTHHQAQEAVIGCGNRLQMEILEPSSCEQSFPSPRSSVTYSHLEYASEAQPYRSPCKEQAIKPSVTLSPNLPPQMSPSAASTNEVAPDSKRVSSTLTWDPQAHTTTLAAYISKPYGSMTEEKKTPDSSMSPLQHTPTNPTVYNNRTPSDLTETICLKSSLSPLPIHLPSQTSPAHHQNSENTSPSVYYSSGDERATSLPKPQIVAGSKRPVCFSCRREIHGPFVDTGSLCFCQEHFNCAQCGIPLAEQQYSESNGKFYCAKDFVELVAPRCAKCSQPIVGLITKALNKSWHPQCFVCAECHKQLRDVFHVEDTGVVLCKEHWEQLHLKVCPTCKQPVSEIDRFIEAFGRCFHAQCFCCAACRTSLDGKRFHPRDGKPFCLVHANAQALYS